MNQETVKAGLVAIALIGNIALGLLFPDVRQLAIGNLGVAIGGYLGQLKPENDKKV